MSSPAARAEARRRAILARGGDRLAKLTTSARGEDASVLHDDVSARPSAAFVGEGPRDTPRPSPPRQSDSAWSDELMQALARDPVLPPPGANDPLASIMAQLSSMNPQGGTAAGKAPAPPAPKPPTRLQKWLPLLHLVSMWSLLAFFVLWREPQAFVAKTAGAVEVAFWKRWPTLATQGTSEGVWGVQAVPFFWAFMTLQVMLHSLRIFSGHNEVQPPVLLSLALPHLPSPLPALITNGLRYLRMGSAFLDDAATVVFGIGMIILVTSWFAG